MFLLSKNKEYYLLIDLVDDKYYYEKAKNIKDKEIRELVTKLYALIDFTKIYRMEIKEDNIILGDKDTIKNKNYNIEVII